MARGQLRTVGATTVDEYRKHFATDKALERRFQPVMVEQPSVETTIQILRGIKERYETHHGIHITDQACVAAATLSARYITDRKLPDKAIDLIDEAASRIKMEIESKPADIDRLERKIATLQMELLSIRQNPDESSSHRENAVEEQLSEHRSELDTLAGRWTREREAIEAIAALRDQIESRQIEGERSQRQGDLEVASRIIYGEIPDLKKTLEDNIERLAEVQKEGSVLSESVGEDDIAQVVGRWTGIAVNRLSQSDLDRLVEMEAHLHARVVSQDEAISVVSKAVRRARVGLQDPKRPVGSFLFLGPTGVGKTELAKALAAFLFDDEHAISRFDMSEYMEKHAVARLVGAPPGYVGHDEGGQLTEAVRRRPYAVLLFDEIEKAHAEVFNILLQVLDDGHLTDSKGRRVDFKNTVIIMTSNLGSQRILEATNRQDAVRAVEEAIHQVLKPEFLNRIDSRVVFDPLTRDDMGSILEIELGELKALLDKRQLRLELSEEAKKTICDIGYDPAFGARPLKRTITQNLLDPLSGRYPQRRILPRRHRTSRRVSRRTGRGPRDHRRPSIAG